jgi:hypothetical protein
MTTLTELEQLVKAATPWQNPLPAKHITDNSTTLLVANPETILRLIELGREMAEALEEIQLDYKPGSMGYGDIEKTLAKYKEMI